jgi:hypothetical protein
MPCALYAFYQEFNADPPQAEKQSKSSPERPYVFPEADLLSAFVVLYFANTNLYYPLLHRPTFERSIAEGLHERDSSFGAVVLLVCAIASRFSDDPRASIPGEDPLRCGWQYFDQLPHVIDHLFKRPSVYHLQYYCVSSASLRSNTPLKLLMKLAVIFLQHSMPAPCWTLIGLGIRLAQDVGAHRAKRAGAQPTVESELWKRAFWVIVCMDRTCSSALGRACTTQYEECAHPFLSSPCLCLILMKLRRGATDRVRRRVLGE